MGDAMTEVRQIGREFAVYFAAAAYALLLALPTTMLGSAIPNDGLQFERSSASRDAAADYELMTASLHWQAKLALADLQRAAVTPH